MYKGRLQPPGKPVHWGNDEVQVQFYSQSRRDAEQGRGEPRL